MPVLSIYKPPVAKPILPINIVRTPEPPSVNPALSTAGIVNTNHTKTLDPRQPNANNPLLNKALDKFYSEVRFVEPGVTAKGAIRYYDQTPEGRAAFARDQAASAAKKKKFKAQAFGLAAIFAAPAVIAGVGGSVSGASASISSSGAGATTAVVTGSTTVAAAGGATASSGLGASLLATAKTLGAKLGISVAGTATGKVIAGSSTLSEFFGSAPFEPGGTVEEYQPPKTPSFLFIGGILALIAISFFALRK